MIPALGNWFATDKGDATARGFYFRHYSSDKRPDHADPNQFIGPGWCIVLLTHELDALFVWRKFISDDKQFGQGINCAIFRNEGPLLSSDLIREADEYAWRKWPGERHYTYVKPSAIRSSNPGCCFLKAGWRRCGVTKSGLIVLECLPARGGAASAS